jgi:hypothetical protein
LLHHILPALVLLRKPLFGLAKRQLQPERYTKIFLPHIIRRTTPSWRGDFILLFF